MKLKLHKISDDRFKNQVKIPVPEGTIRVEDMTKFPMPEVGKWFLFGTLITTPIEKILVAEEGYIKFKTRNSTYLLTY